MLHLKLTLTALSAALSILLAPVAAQAQQLAIQTDAPYLTTNGFIVAQATGFASDGASRVYVAAQVFGVHGTPYSAGARPGDGYGIARGQGWGRCARGRGFYYARGCAWQQLRDGRWWGPVCQNSPNHIIPC